MAEIESREASAAPSSGADTIEDQPEDSKPSIATLEHEDSAADVTAAAATAAGTPSSIRSKRGRGSGVKKARPKKGTHVWINEGPGEGTEDEGAETPSSRMKKSGSPDADGRTQGNAVGTRRQANGTVGSVYSGSKVRHIKQADGTPLWRKEIQYEFLRLVIEDTHPVFTRYSDGKKNCTFVEIYVDCMARSSKTSKILKDRLQVDSQAAHNMAMICLLVNVGRMNTTLNFFPEMRAQLRTYHSIPSLQAYKSQKDYKSLQDAPRLKSILKGASEDTEEPRTLSAVKSATVPRTNPVNLIFVLSQSAAEVAQLHFTDKVDFFDLVIRSTISSASRARAFLWVMWWYLEAKEHNRQAALENPFGPGEFKEGQDPNNLNEVPLLVPKLVAITEEEGDAENEDPEEEKVFAERMTKERKRILAEVASGEFDAKEPEHKGVKRLKKNARDFDDDSDADSARASPGVRRSPAVEGVMGMMSGGAGGSLSGQADSIEDDWEAVDPHPGRGRYKRIKGKNTPGRNRNNTTEGVSSTRKGTGRASGLGFEQGTPDTVGVRSTPQPLPPNSANHPVISQYSRRGQDDGGLQTTKSRARTGYQRQLEAHRNSRIEWLLRKKQRDALKDARAKREGDRWLRRVALRLQDLDVIYDSEEDEDGVGVSYDPSLHTIAVGLAFGASAPGAHGNGIGLGGLVARKAVTMSNRDVGDGEQVDSKLNVSITEMEEDDFGEETESWLKVLRRTKRRLETWSGDKDHSIYLAKNNGEKLPVNGNSKKRSQTQSHARPISKRSGGVLRTGRGSGRGGRRGVGSVRRGRISTPASSARARRREMSLNDEITQDLLAERSEDEDQDPDNEQDGDGEDDGDVDDVVMEDNANDGDADGDATGEDSDVDMDQD